MLKLLGAACVVIASIGYAGHLLKKEKFHRDILQALVSMAELLAGYIGYERLTMEDALLRLPGGYFEGTNTAATGTLHSGAESALHSGATVTLHSGADGALHNVLARMADRLAAGADESFEAVWHAVFCEEASNLFLREEELSVVLEMGKGLGGADVETQARRLHGSARRLEEKKTDAAREFSEKRRLYRYLGVAVGAMAALVLL